MKIVNHSTLCYNSYIKKSEMYLWPHRLMVRTAGSQPVNTGSIPVGATTPQDGY